jgi:hypothetical protein
MSHVNNNSSVRRNNVNPNSGVWSGWFPQGEAQPGSPRMPSTPQRSYNYSGETGGMTGYGGNIAGPLDNVGKQTSQMVKQAALTGFAVTGDLLPGPRSQHPYGKGGRGGFPDGSGAGNPANTSRSQARGLSPSAHPAQVIRGEIQGAAQMAALDAGPRVHAMPPRKEIPPAGNNWETTTHRALGPGPSSQFDNNAAVGDVRGDLAEAAQLMGGKQVSMGRSALPTSNPMSGTQRQDAQTARKRKTGGKPGMLGRILDT